MNNEPKFTPGPWKFIRVQPEIDTFAIRTINDDTLAAVGVSPVGWREGKDIANAALIAASPELYDNEEKNLTLLKTILKCYENVEKLMLIDKDVQTAIQNETINGIMMPEVMHLIIEDLKTRITESERVLAKTRGDSNNA